MEVEKSWRRSKSEIIEVDAGGNRNQIHLRLELEALPVCVETIENHCQPREDYVAATEPVMRCRLKMSSKIRVGPVI